MYLFCHKKIKLLVFFLVIGACPLFWSCSSSHEADIFLPVDLGKIPAGLTVTEPLLKGIEVHVVGSKSAIATLHKLNIRYTLNLSGAKLGINTVNISRDSIPLPKEIKILDINPSFLTINIENETKKRLPVIISFSGNLASGFMVADAVSKPSSVILKGPENILDPLDKVLTKPVDINGLSESFKKEIALDLAEGLKIISSPEIILGEILIKEKIVSRKFQDIPVKGKNITSGYKITPSVIDIEVKGPFNTLERLFIENGLKVYVDIENLKPGIYVRRAAITLPVHTTLIGAKPEVFTVTIEN